MADLQLQRIRCLQANEKDGDEIYVLFSAKRGGKEVAKERVPADMNHYKMKHGDTVSPEHLLYIEKIGEGGIDLTVTLMEMDVLRIFKNSFGIVGTWIDDFVGQVTFKLAPDGQVETVLGKHTSLLTDDTKADDGLHHFQMLGNASDYQLTLKLQIGGKSIH